MKTQNNNQKKFENHTGKKILFGGLILLAFGLVSLRLYSQKYQNPFFAKDSYSNLAMVLADQSVDFEIPSSQLSTGNMAVYADYSGTTETFAVQQEDDAAMKIEAWMTDVTNFVSSEEFNAIDAEEDLNVEDWMIHNSVFLNHLNFETVDQEKELEIESWMIDAATFVNSVDLSSADNEKELNVEDWMVNHTFFRNAVDCISVDQEEALKIEPWMTNVAFFTSAGTEKTLKVEAWMVNSEVFKNNKVQLNPEINEAAGNKEIAHEL
ncbi:MAG: hypothetical protein WAO52_11400 [Prolixibacteraceae bacterium]